VNWSACLQTDRKVREEWTRNLLLGTKRGTKDPHGSLFLGREWQECMDTVERYLQVQLPRKEDHNPANSALLEGSRLLGYAVKSVPQNIRGSFEEHAKCGANCTIGCRGYLGQNEDEGGKMSGCRVFLKPLLEDPEVSHVHGLDGFVIDKIVFSKERGKENQAVGAVSRSSQVIRRPGCWYWQTGWSSRQVP
jgi:hypothetical protein